MKCDHKEAIRFGWDEGYVEWCPACGALHDVGPGATDGWRAPTGPAAIADENPNALSELAAETVRDLRTRIGVDVACVFLCRVGDSATGCALDTGPLPYSTGAMIAVEGIVNVHNVVLGMAVEKAKEDR